MWGRRWCRRGGLDEESALEVWPDTDDESLEPRASQASSEGGDEKVQADVPAEQAEAPSQGSRCVAACEAWPSGLTGLTSQGMPFMWEAWEIPTPDRQMPIGEKVIEGFGRALRKAVGEVPNGRPVESCFQCTGTAPDIEEFIWHLHRNGCPPVA